MDNFAKAGGKMFVCSPCFKKRKLDENNLVAGAAVVGGAKLVEFMSDGAARASATDPARRSTMTIHRRRLSGRRGWYCRR